MMKEKILKLIDIFKIKDGENNKRKIEILVVFIIILIVIIIIINTIWNSDSKKNKSEYDESKVLAQTEIKNSEKGKLNETDSSNLEEKLKNILAKIDGVGKVDILITYSESSELKAMYNEDSTKNDTEEQDTSRWK